ncbi:heavy-metal-associated domain-containing protein [Thalassobacillus devorans]|uniref:heavy-metal-associated domain-containing protein n=1 Tax=Thalassobacillus devorans TaxID=279813 RepID=UPI00048F0F38|nr:heavy-metal-associated domain-containing protein [Thalassobacillus devorans]
MITRTFSIADFHKDDEARVEEILYDVWGVRNVAVNSQLGLATVSFDENAASWEDFTQAVADSGFEVNGG